METPRRAVCRASCIRSPQISWKAVFYLLVPVLFFSCPRRELVSFPAEGSLYGLNDAAVSGTLNISKIGRVFEYRFDPPLRIQPLEALELEYLAGDGGIGVAGEELKNRLELVVRVSGGGAWVLPWDASFLPVKGGEYGGEVPFRYAIPLEEGYLEGFSITAEGDGGEDLKRKLRDSPLTVRLRGLRRLPRWYGLFRDPAGAVSATPFVYVPERGQIGIDPPAAFRFGGGADLSVKGSAGDEDTGEDLTVQAGGFRFRSLSPQNELRIPSGFFPDDPCPILVNTPAPESIRLSPGENRPFPLPISLDPGLVLSYPRNSWRNRDYEVFSWESFPSILIFDTADYATQDRLLKRLAFFVEKAGYRGRLAGDAEIADLHGWNAHDYRAGDLARFFELARIRDFPLLAEERELEKILLDAGIIRRNGEKIEEGEGGIVSISRESPDYLRALFMAHEGYHGIFFIDRDFRDFSRSRWDRLSPTAKRFILSYFDYQHYDIKDQYLVLNEFMAHVLQQPVSRAAAYFGETLAGRIDASSWRRAVLPEKDETSGSWPDLARAFRAEAEAFSAYAGRRWGLSAGRVWQVTVSR